MLSCVVKLRFKSANCKRFSFRPFPSSTHGKSVGALLSVQLSEQLSTRPQLQTCTCNWRRCHVHHKFLMVPHALPLLRSRSQLLPLLLATCLQWPRALATATIEATLKMQNRCENLEFFCNHNAFSVKSQRSHRHLHVRCVTLKLIIICQFRLSLCTGSLSLARTHSFSPFLCHTLLPSLSGLH